jgi:hypothetical protein
MLLLKSSKRRASQQICQQERKKNSKKKTAPAQNPKTAPLSKTTKLPGHNKSPNSGFPASSSLLLQKPQLPVTITEIAKMRLKNLLGNLFVRNVSSLTPLFLLQIISLQKKPATTFEHKKNPQPNSFPKHARSPTLLGIL